jgi:transposase
MIWFAGSQSQTLQQTMSFLDKTLKEAFDKKNPQRFPWFKKKGRGIDSFRYPQGFKLDRDRVFLAKIGWVRFINSQDIEGTPGNVTVSSVSLPVIRLMGYFFKRQIRRIRYHFSLLSLN